jgi:uncharacterized protein YcaQ
VTAQQALAISPAEARRLAVSRQFLSATRPPDGADGVRAVARSLRFLQLDPVKVIARSHELVLWSRLGGKGASHFDDLMWRDRWLFEYWAHAAAIVLTEDYAVHRVWMDGFPWPGGNERIKTWVAANDRLRIHVLSRLGEGEPLPTDAFDDCADVDWPSTGWTNGRNVERMLGFLWWQGKVMIAARTAGRRLWGLPEHCLPPNFAWEPMSLPEMVTAATEHALRARGVARQLDILQYFVPGRYKDLPDVLRTLTEQGRVQPVRIEGGPPSETWYVHADALSDLEAIRTGDWQGRTALLSPFDNMIIDRRLTERLWGFPFRMELYVPKAKREYGYYVLPILHGDQLIGRVEPRFDRRRGAMVVEGLWLEPDVKPTAALRRAITAELTDLAGFVGAAAVEYGDRVPDRWRTALRRS